MHPHIISDKQGSCPICGMDLVELKLEPALPEQPGERSEVMIPPVTIQNMGVVTERAAYSHFGRQIRAYGSVAVNERSISAIAVRVEGWVESLEVDAVGDRVKKGDRLFLLYSPELLHAQRDYLNALGSGHKGRTDLTRNRLRSLGMAPQNIDTITRRKKVLEHVPFFAPEDGIVTALSTAEGGYLKPGMEVMALTDYATVWVRASVSEQDAVYLDATTRATIVQRGLGNITYEATVDYIYPEMERKTRTVPVRLVLQNSRGILRPGNYVEVRFESDFDYRLSVPEDALLRHSEGSYVIIALGEGRFVPRRVEPGFRHEGRVAIDSGLNEGESIVTSGQFLIDSESALRDAITNMRQEVHHDHAGH
jgi:Cu(I)/Ag(I) efflux system membrane fusion protein